MTVESSHKNSILIVCDSINIDDSSGSKANVEMIMNLKKSGFRLKVYHYTRKEADLPGIECISVQERKFNLNYVLSKMNLMLWRAFRINTNPFFAKRFGFSFEFFNDVKSIFRALQKEITFNPDWVLTLSKAASFRPHAALLKLPSWHDKWLAYVHDPYPMHFYPCLTIG